MNGSAPGRVDRCLPVQKHRLERELATCVWNNKPPMQVEHKMVTIKVRWEQHVIQF